MDLTVNSEWECALRPTLKRLASAGTRCLAQPRELCENNFKLYLKDLLRTDMHRSVETHERSPLLESGSFNSRESLGEYEGYSGGTCLEDILYAWPLVWLDQDHRYRLVLCAGITLLQLFFYARVPYLFGSVVEGVFEPEIWVLLTELLLCVFLRDYLCTRLRSWIWQPYALRSQQLTAEKIQGKVFECPGKHSIWSSGGFLSDFNKGGSLNTCLEKVLFTWIPIALKLVMTTKYVWMLLGTFYGLAIAIISLWYIYCITRNSLRSISWNRKVVAAKRHKDAVA